MDFDASSRLGLTAWPDVDASSVLLVPLGSTEQHGPHLPLDTDTRIATAVAQGAAAAVDGAVAAPALPYGASGEHAGFAGTLSIGTEALHTVIVELARSAAMTFSRLVLVNGHGGNHDGVRRAVDQLVAEGHAVTSWSPRIAGGDAHAGRTETSLMLAIAPALVAVDKAVAGNVSPIVELIDDLRAGGVAAVAPNGVLGDPAGASAEEGQVILTTLIDSLIAHLATL